MQKTCHFHQGKSERYTERVKYELGEAEPKNQLKRKRNWAAMLKSSKRSEQLQGCFRSRIHIFHRGVQWTG